MTSAGPLYEEHVRATTWFALVMRVMFLAPLFGMLATLRDPNVSASGRALSIAGLLAVSGVLLGVALWFTALHVTVARDVLRFRFGPFGRTLGASHVREVRSATYSPLAFGGWGWRFGRLAGRTVRAYTVPFLRTGVEVTTDTGKTYYVSSRQPVELAAAVRGMTGREGAA